jgi:hypothetical protein
MSEKKEIHYEIVNSSVYEVKKVREDIGIISTGWDRE